MSKFYLRLKELRCSRRLSQKELADLLKISKSSINMYERGEREPKLDTIEAIADFFNVDLDYLMGATSDIKAFDEIPREPLNAEEEKLLNAYRSFNAEGQERLLQYAEDMSNLDRYKKERGKSKMANNS